MSSTASRGLPPSPYVAIFTNSNRFTAVDVYADEAAYLAHLDSPQTRWLVNALDGVLIGSPRGAFHHKICDESDFRAGMAHEN